VRKAGELVVKQAGGGWSLVRKAGELVGKQTGGGSSCSVLI
jgi:hypothetical protein